MKGEEMMYAVEEGEVLARVIWRGNSENPVVRFGKRELSIEQWNALKERVDRLIREK